MRPILPVGLIFILLTIGVQPAASCTIPKGLASDDLKAADVVVRAFLQKFEVVEPNTKARLTLEVREAVFGFRSQGEILALWESPTGEMQDHWTSSRDVLVALKRINFAEDGVWYRIIQPSCAPPSLMEFNAQNTWRLAEAMHD
ncbi:hypothetical protein IFT59_20570 [Rhizobium sp. CFBP 8752]|uniref:hypothetical protein n=1 Tax=Rhizobium sp. CFBP 8752 TaxID=2775301 RepID=UPI00177CDAA8|nr:hypothetical protein [Rhizobium sp. CFBP 8752]MBD8665644.1 hypothetical protein [Rhizobium sp. CFBP 8752]